MFYKNTYKLLYFIIKKFRKNFKHLPNRTELIKNIIKIMAKNTQNWNIFTTKEVYGRDNNLILSCKRR